MLLGLRTTIYPAPDLAASRAFFTGVLEVEPYFDEPFYVGYDVGGYELGLLPVDGAVTTAYWGVPDADAAVAALVAAGATVGDGVTDVGGGIRTATVVVVGGGVLGVIENPHFASRAVDSPGPGR